MQLDFGVKFSVVNESLDHLLYRLSQRFQAGVYAPEESLKVLAENPGWRDRMHEAGGLQRRWNQWKQTVDAARQRGQYEGQRAQQKMAELVAQVPPTPWYER